LHDPLANVLCYSTEKTAIPLFFHNPSLRNNPNIAAVNDEFIRTANSIYGLMVIEVVDYQQPTQAIGLERDEQFLLQI